MLSLANNSSITRMPIDSPIRIFATSFKLALHYRPHPKMVYNNPLRP